MYDLLHAQGLQRFYTLRGAQAGLAATSTSTPQTDWLAAATAVRADGLSELSCDVAGLRCTACVWLIESLAERDQVGVTVDPTHGKLRLRFDAARYAPEVFVERLGAFGYRLGPAHKDTASTTRPLLMRLGISAGLATNVMLLSFAFYFGLNRETPSLSASLGWLSFILTLACVSIGGSYFFKTAYASLRQGVWHIDVPIALSLMLAFAASTFAWQTAGAGAAYFDTVCAFVALMLAGKYLPERLLERNQATLLADDGVDRLAVKRVCGASVQRVPAGQIEPGDRLLIAVGDVVAVGSLAVQAGVCSHAWIDGESDVIAHAEGDRLPAGATNVGLRPFIVTAQTRFSESELRALLVQPATTVATTTWHARWMHRFSRVYVVMLLALAAATFTGWWFVDPARGLLATVAVLVVACPCAIGIATPVAAELSLRRLRQLGLFVRRRDALEKLADVDCVAFDKTGTLTDARLDSDSLVALGALSPVHRGVLRALVERSNHPVSQALLEALVHADSAPLSSVEDQPGVGLGGVSSEGITYRLKQSAAGQTLFSDDARVLAVFSLTDQPRPDAKAALQALVGLGYRTLVLSGDLPARVAALADQLGLAQSDSVGGLSPSEKARALIALGGARVLMLGDGINDLAAFDAAHCAGTPAVDRPFVPARADFYYASAGLQPIRDALLLARRFRNLVRFNLAFAVAYNVVVLTLAVAGIVTPLIAAVLMPASSLFIVWLNGHVTGRALPGATIPVATVTTR